MWGPGTLKAPAAWMSEVGQSGEDENYVGVFGGFFEVLFSFGGAGKGAEERKATASPNVRPLHSRQPSRFSLELAPISAPTSANKTIYQLLDARGSNSPDTRKISPIAPRPPATILLHDSINIRDSGCFVVFIFDTTETRNACSLGQPAPLSGRRGVPKRAPLPRGTYSSQEMNVSSVLPVQVSVPGPPFKVSSPSLSVAFRVSLPRLPKRLSTSSSEPVASMTSPPRLPKMLSSPVPTRSRIVSAWRVPTQLSVVHWISLASATLAKASVRTAAKAPSSISFFTSSPSSSFGSLASPGHRRPVPVTTPTSRPLPLSRSSSIATASLPRLFRPRDDSSRVHRRRIGYTLGGSTTTPSLVFLRQPRPSYPDFGYLPRYP